MLLYSIILPIIAILAIVSFAYRYLNERISLFTLSLWNIFWIFVIVFSIFPNSSMIFAKIFGINRGLDFIIMVAFVVLFYIIFKLYFKLDPGHGVGLHRGDDEAAGDQGDDGEDPGHDPAANRY